MIKNDIFFSTSLNIFLDYVQSYPGAVDDVMKTILRVLLNFTYEEEKGKRRVSLQQYYVLGDVLLKL